MDKRVKRICHITTVHPRYDTRIFVKECASLAANGFEVYLIVADGKGDEIKNGVNIQDIGKPANRRKRHLYYSRKIRSKAETLKADLYHFHDPELLRAGARLRRKGHAVVYDAHEDVPRQMLTKAYLPGPVWKIIAALFERYENSVARKLSGVITATPFIRDRFLKIQPRVVEVQNFPFLKEFKKEEANPPLSKEDAVCYVGSITKVRGIFPVVEALSYVGDTTLLLGGNFESEELREAVVKTPGWEYVKELGFLSREAVSETMAKSMAGLVVLYPTINYLDSIPVKMFEYMAAGIPVIASDFPYWKKLLEGVDCALFVDPLDPKAIAEAIAWLKQHPDRVKEMGVIGRKAVEVKFNWGNEERKLVSFYESILNE